MRAASPARAPGSIWRMPAPVGDGDRHQLRRDRVAVGGGRRGGERARERARGALVLDPHDDRARGHVAQPAAVPRDHRADAADDVGEGQEVDDPHAGCAPPSRQGRSAPRSPSTTRRRRAALPGVEPAPEPLQQQEVSDRRQGDAADRDRQRERARRSRRRAVRMPMTIASHDQDVDRPGRACGCRRPPARRRR